MGFFVILPQSAFKKNKIRFTVQDKPECEFVIEILPSGNLIFAQREKFLSFVPGRGLAVQATRDASIEFRVNAVCFKLPRFRCELATDAKIKGNIVCGMRSRLSHSRQEC
jgi:hypothetical protein